MKVDCVSERSIPCTRVHQPSDIYPILGKRYGSKKQEHFIVVCLRGDHSVSRIRLVGIGLANRALVHPREVFGPAIIENAVSIIIAHNHPSGNLEASTEDNNITRRLVDAGALLGIPVLDHIIFGKQGYSSYLDKGFMPIASTKY